MTEKYFANILMVPEEVIKEVIGGKKRDEAV
jgi:hypothetical protein